MFHSKLELSNMATLFTVVFYDYVKIVARIIMLL